MEWTNKNIFPLPWWERVRVRGSSLVFVLLFSLPALADPLSGLNLGEFDSTKPGQLKWENNPFVQTLESVGVQDMNLTAIIYRPGNAAALINGRVMKEGDRIGSSQVMHIEARRVVMRNEDGIYSLTMGGRGK